MRIGIDLGGTKTEIIALNKDNGKELYRQRVPTPRNDYKANIKNIVNLIRTAEKTLGKKGTVGLGIPGTISKTTGRIKNANSTWLNGEALQQDLERELKRPVRVQNDANCFAVSEATDGAAQGLDVVFGVIIGTGCGGGVVVNGKPVSGLNGVGGEWGHNSLLMPRFYSEDPSLHLNIFDEGADPKKMINKTYAAKDLPVFFTDDKDWNEYPGPQCYCGKRGCVEQWISGPAFKSDYERITGESLSTHDIIAAATRGEEKAVAALDRYIDRLARSLAGIIDVIDPDAIVLGGGMSNVNQLYSAVPKIWDKYIFTSSDDKVDTKLLPPRYGDSSGVRGAAWLWEAHETDTDFEIKAASA